MKSTRHSGFWDSDQALATVCGASRGTDHGPGKVRARSGSSQGSQFKFRGTRRVWEVFAMTVTVLGLEWEA